MRQQRIHARLGRWRIEKELGLAILLHDSVVVPNHNRSVRLPVRCHPQTKESQINQKCQESHSCAEKQYREKNPPDPLPEIERHDARL